MRFTEHADEWMEFVYAAIGIKAFAELKRKALGGGKVDWIAEAQRLAEIQKAAA